MLSFILGLIVLSGADEPAAPDFAREIRPLLSRHCFKCHGPDADARQGGLRLDEPAAAYGKGESDEAAIVPGKPAVSEVFRRIRSADPGSIMPPPSAKNPLTDDQKKLIERWIASGAPYAKHWAFAPPARISVPPLADDDRPFFRNRIDPFILERLRQAGLRPSPEANRAALIRRVSLDLIGLPPTPEEMEAFENDRHPAAYERLVDRLLSSERYGERQARRWLDLARYADTNGYEKDRPRSIWPYRDWVIRALNDDMPFDRFTINQLAGDMLPGATESDRIATGFHRNTMINEEGGIDPLEFRFHAMTDRIATTGTAWLGLTVGCAQCHTHKYDPIQHREYYGLMAFLDNADEPVMNLHRADHERTRQEVEAEMARLRASLANEFPEPEPIQYRMAQISSVTSSGGARPTVGTGAIVSVTGPNPDVDDITLTLRPEVGAEGNGEPVKGAGLRGVSILSLRLEALADSTLPSNGPGRTPHGNFVITGVDGDLVTERDRTPLKFAHATADFTQPSFDPAGVFDANDRTGWAIHGTGNWNVDRKLTLHLEPVFAPPGSRIELRLRQRYGGGHNLGRFRIRLGESDSAAARGDQASRRKAHLERRFAEWKQDAAGRAVDWRPARVVSAKADVPKLKVMPDGSILALGDISKRDVYELSLATDLPQVTAVRVVALPDESLPAGGPGKVWYEGPPGDFFLSEIQATRGGKAIPFASAAQSFGTSAQTAIDGDPQSGWSVNGGQGRQHHAIFQFAEPVPGDAPLELALVFERYYAASLGRFRIEVTDQPNPGIVPFSPEIEARLVRSRQAARDADVEGLTAALRADFLSVAPELEAARKRIEARADAFKPWGSTLVLAERPPEHPRPTFRRHRGEYLQPKEQVPAGIPAFLPDLPKGAPRNRLEFARWLVSPENPLTARVTVNRQWQMFFGRGLVKTVDDFGYQGEAPSHPELLDWLAEEFVRGGWSMKRLHKLIVMSGTYRQAATVTPTMLAKDPENRLLGRFARTRIEAEMVRDSLLAVSGLLSPKMYGPGVFPPQPAGITTEGAYGPLAWNVSTGHDRYRRGIYTFMKRTAPYAMASTFDGPSGEACLARREVSNTPLQALTMLNDEVTLEAARALGRTLAVTRSTTRPGGAAADDDGTVVVAAVQRVLARKPTPDEHARLGRLVARWRDRFRTNPAEAASVAGSPPDEAGKPAPSSEVILERAVWTALARTLFNLDEFVTKG
jgi:mono/diheme cytochrome c family protein